MYNEKFMKKAILLSEKNIEIGGGPFGAVVVKDGKIIATGCNRVTRNSDPTAHAEVTAIRNACKKIGTFNLENCDIYTSCEPCPMCLSAIYWAHISNIYYGNTKKDAAEINFDDSFIYDELEKNPSQRAIPAHQHLHKEATAAFEKWKNKDDKVAY